MSLTLTLSLVIILLPGESRIHFLSHLHLLTDFSECRYVQENMLLQENIHGCMYLSSVHRAKEVSLMTDRLKRLEYFYSVPSRLMEFRNHTEVFFGMLVSV